MGFITMTASVHCYAITSLSDNECEGGWEVEKMGQRGAKYVGIERIIMMTPQFER